MKRKKYEHRRQHFVPACYLKAWLDPSAPKTSKNTPYVWLFDKKGENPKAKAPEKIFRESNMYTLTMPDGGHDLQLEHGLGTVESNFTKVRTSKFNFKRPLAEEDWLWTCLFAATAYNRTAASRDHFLSQMEKVKEMFEKVAGPDWETRTVEPELHLGLWLTSPVAGHLKHSLSNGRPDSNSHSFGPSAPVFSLADHTSTYYGLC